VKKTKMSLFCGLMTMGSMAFAQSGSLMGADALTISRLLTQAGVRSSHGVEGSVLQVAFILCEDVRSPMVRCDVSLAATDPSDTRFSLASGTPGSFAELLQKAGVKPFVSQLSDGSAGRILLEANSILCFANKPQQGPICDIEFDTQR